MPHRLITIALRLLVVAGVAIALWYFLSWLLFVGPSSWRNQKALQQFGSFVPPEAEEVFIEDTHMGFHGDGDTFLTFRCSVECLKSLQLKIAATSRGLLSSTGWSNQYPSEEVKKRVIATAMPAVGSSPSKKRESLQPPSFEGASVVHFCVFRPSDPEYCTDLYLIDYSQERFWYFNVTF